MRASIAACLVAAVTLLAISLLGGGPAVAFADVQKQIEQITTLSYLEVQDLGGGHKMTARIMVKEPGLERRQEADIAGQVDITDLQKGVHVTLIPLAKVAMISRWPAGETMEYSEGLFVMDTQGKEYRSKGPDIPSTHVPQGFLGELKDLVKKSQTPLGPKEIDGRRVEGFRLGTAPDELELWVDAKTALPVEIVKHAPMPYGQGGQTLSGFEVNKPMDDSLFDTVPPKGYKVRELPGPLTPLTEKDLLAGLATLAKLNEGAFPDEPYAGTEMLLRPYNDPSLGEYQRWEISNQASYPNLFLNRLPTHRWGYLGKGVKLGDAKQIVLWYMPAEAKLARAVYADLSAKDVPPAELPGDAAKAATRPVEPQSMTKTGVGTVVMVGTVTVTGEVTSKGARTSSRPATQTAPADGN